jgi:hypothetical protein
MNSQKIELAELTKFLFVRQPISIRERLARLPRFERQLGVGSRFTVDIPAVGSVDAVLLFEATKKLLSGGDPSPLTCLDGSAIVSGLEQGTVVLRKANAQPSDPQVALRELALLSPHSKQRVHAYKGVIERIGVAAPRECYALRQCIESQLPSNDELTLLLKELSTGVVSTQARIAEAMHTGQPKLGDLVPANIDYYENFCGPVPDESQSPDDYVAATLAAYRQNLIERDFAKGLDICLLGGLTADLHVAQWISGSPNDQVWEALQHIDPWRDPFSLANAFAIAFQRCDDDRFREFSGESAKKLLAPTFECSKGKDCFELLPIFSSLVLDRLNDTAQLNSSPGYWKRMCAWMHGAVLLRVTRAFVVNTEDLSAWMQRCRSVKSVFTRLRDLKAEPMFRAAEMSKAALVAEILGRVKLIAEPHAERAALLGIPALIAGAEERVSLDDPYGWFTPGPLEGHRTPREKERRFSEMDITQCLEMIEKADLERMWFGLAKMSQLSDLTEVVLRAAKDRTRKILEEQLEAKACRIEPLSYAAIVAAAHRDKELADVVASPLPRAIHDSTKEEDVSSAVQVLLMAAAAHARENEWTDWLSDKLTKLAFAVPRGAKVKTLEDLLAQLRPTLPLGLTAVDRAEAVVSAV